MYLLMKTHSVTVNQEALHNVLPDPHQPGHGCDPIAEPLCPGSPPPTGGCLAVGEHLSTAAGEQEEEITVNFS